MVTRPEPKAFAWLSLIVPLPASNFVPPEKVFPVADDKFKVPADPT
jgi:hypothetical protein